MNKIRGQVSGRGMVQEVGLILIILNRPDLGSLFAKVGYLRRSNHVAHSLWDVLLNCACVGDERPMTPRSKNEDCRENVCCYRSKSSKKH